MILKVTCGDNDYTQFLELFFEKREMLNFTFYFECKRTITDKEDKIERFNEMSMKDEEFQELARDILLENKYYNEGKYNRLIELFKEKLIIFFENNINKIEDFDIESIEYIKKSLKVEILPAMVNKWENGEVIYYFYNNNKFITQ